MVEVHFRTSTGLDTDGWSTGRAWFGWFQTVATATATQASRPAATTGAGSGTVGATVAGGAERGGTAARVAAGRPEPQLTATAKTAATASSRPCTMPRDCSD